MRLSLLNLMGKAEVCACFFVEVLKTNQPKISRHLAYLRRAGIVGARRQGSWSHHRIFEPEDQDAARVLKDVLAWLTNDREMQRDTANDWLMSVTHRSFPSVFKAHRDQSVWLGYKPDSV